MRLVCVDVVGPEFLAERQSSCHPDLAWMEGVSDH